MLYTTVIVECGDGYIKEIDRLRPVGTMAEAQADARRAGYVVVDNTSGGQCETSDTWDGVMRHIVTVSAA